jgi:hypothetical protein
MVNDSAWKKAKGYRGVPTGERVAIQFPGWEPMEIDARYRRDIDRLYAVASRDGALRDPDTGNLNKSDASRRLIKMLVAANFSDVEGGTV